MRMCRGGRNRCPLPQGQQRPPSTQGPSWSLLQERGLVICSLVTKDRSPGVAMETRLPCRLRKKRLTGADPHGKSGSDRETRRERKREEREQRGVRGEG